MDQDINQAIQSNIAEYTKKYEENAISPNRKPMLPPDGYSFLVATVLGDYKKINEKVDPKDPDRKNKLHVTIKAILFNHFKDELINLIKSQNERINEIYRKLIKKCNVSKFDIYEFDPEEKTFRLPLGKICLESLRGIHELIELQRRQLYSCYSSNVYIDVSGQTTIKLQYADDFYRAELAQKRFINNKLLSIEQTLEKDSQPQSGNIASFIKIGSISVILILLIMIIIIYAIYYFNYDLALKYYPTWLLNLIS